MNKLGFYENTSTGKREFPLLVQEGWLRLQCSLLALFTGGDGVVKEKLGWLISTTSPKSM
jgi:hypothetical protein